MSKLGFVFYDLETSGLNPRSDRIMQFAAIRTDLDLNPIGEPFNFLIKLSDDTLPSPVAISVTGITPQKTIEEGYTEAEACDLILNEIFTPNTIVVGYNNVRFDDEFIRHLFWRNFRDPYEWTYKDGRSRWDLLDVVRFTRAVRPGKIKWPIGEDGKPTNRLELLSQLNKLEHSQAHDALSDVEALIEVGRLIKESDPKMWGYLLKMRDKRLVQQLVNLDHPAPFVYSSGRLESEFEKTTLAYPIFDCKNNNIMVYNLRYDPVDLLDKSPSEIALFLSKHSKSKDVKSDDKNGDTEVNERRVYFKTLRYNRCPAVAPMSVLRKEDYARLKLDSAVIKQRVEVLRNNPKLIQNIKILADLKERQIEQKFADESPAPAEERLYDAFLDDPDKRRVQEISQLSSNELRDYRVEFSDERLPEMFLGYKARSFPRSLSEAEVLKWEKWRTVRLQRQLPNFIQELEALAQDESTEFCVSELKLWLESIVPADSF
ncbi:MAG: exodeoxyribonuclease I [Candidatus Nanosyncoccaceae bacterium]|jgi:exodeoxyribonuclease-1